MRMEVLVLIQFKIIDATVLLDLKVTIVNYVSVRISSVEISSLESYLSMDKCFRHLFFYVYFIR